MDSASSRAAARSATSPRGAHALGQPFLQMPLGREYIQELLLEQERRNQMMMREQERRMQERMLKLERTMEGRIRQLEWMMQRDEKVAETSSGRANEYSEDPTSAAEQQRRRVEQRVGALERRLASSGGQGRVGNVGVEERIGHLESRMEQLEASVQKALVLVFPRVDALLSQLEKPSPRVASLHPNATSPSTSDHASASVSTPAPRHISPSTGNAAPPPPTSERQKALGTTLIKAAEDGREADILRLLDSGADVNFTDVGGLAPLLAAAASSHANIVSLMLRRGANIHAKTTWGDTALHLASFNDKSGRCTSLIIRAGAPVDSANNRGRTPLHLAAMAGNEAATGALLAAGARRTVGDSYGKTPFDLASTKTLRRLLRL